MTHEGRRIYLRCVLLQKHLHILFNADIRWNRSEYPVSVASALPTEIKGSNRDTVTINFIKEE